MLVQLYTLQNNWGEFELAPHALQSHDACKRVSNYVKMADTTVYNMILM